MTPGMSFMLPVFLVVDSFLISSPPPPKPFVGSAVYPFLFKGMCGMDRTDGLFLTFLAQQDSGFKGILKPVSP